MTPMSRRRFSSRRGGVSDIIGTILILAITVTLFSSIFFFVSSFPGPPAQSTSQFNAKLGIVGTNIAWINVTYDTGPDLPSADLEFFISSSTYGSHFACSPLEPYSLSSGLISGAIWVAGETWTLQMNAAHLCSGFSTLPSANDNITVSIVNVAQDLTLLSITLPGTVAEIPPQFTTDGTAPSPIQANGPFDVWADIAFSTATGDSATVTFNGIPGPITEKAGTGPALSAGCSSNPVVNCIATLSLNATTGQWATGQLTAASSVEGNSYPVVITAIDGHGLTNSAVTDIQFVAPQGISLEIKLTASPGNPYLTESTLITASITNTQGGSGAVWINFTATNTQFGKLWYQFTNPVSISAFASLQESVLWNATGPGGGPGLTLINVTASAPYSPDPNTLGITIYPRTLLIDGTGIPRGSLVPLDTFTYVTTDFISADIPYNVTIAPPGSTTITTSLLTNYDDIIYDVGNATGACISSSNAVTIEDAITGTGIASKSVWIMGTAAFSSSCSSDSTYSGSFGLGSLPALGAKSTLASLSFDASSPIPTNGTVTGNTWGAYYSVLPAGTSTPYLCAAATCPTSGATNVVGSGYTDTAGKRLFAMSMDLYSMSQQLPKGSAVQTSTGVQSSLAFNVYDWLAGFVKGTPPYAYLRQSDDWAVSQVAITPTNVSYGAKVLVNITVRNNGPYALDIPPTLLVSLNGLPYTTLAPSNPTAWVPSAYGGSYSSSITWTPFVFGYASLEACIYPPSNDSSSTNNCMSSSLFNVSILLRYSVLLVDDTLHSTILSGSTDTTSTIYNALIAAGYPGVTITNATITGTSGSAGSRCSGALPNAVNITNFNLLIWNDGSNINSTGCPISNVNAGLISTFLTNGGVKSSLLYIGAGLLTDKTDGPVENLAQNYLGVNITNSPSSTITPTNALYGQTTNGIWNDSIGDGLTLPYTATGKVNTYCLANLYSNPAFGVTVSPVLYFGMSNYWNGGTTGSVCGSSASPQIAASEAYATKVGWDSSFWAFNPGNVTSSSSLSLLTLRASTYFGRLLPGVEPTVSVPDITFATTTTPWTNFTGMDPQLEQQYLIRANVTNWGGGLDSDVGVSIYDGTHILGSQTLSIGGSTESAEGNVSVGMGQLSVSWTPLYAGVNPIQVVITTSTAGDILPSVETSAQWNVTVYFFYDNTTNNQNQWQSNDLIQWEDAENPNCGSPPVARQIFYDDDNQIPTEWDLSDPGNGCPPTGYTEEQEDGWGLNFTACYETLWICGSLAVQDDAANTNTYVWGKSAVIAVPSGVSSAYATWWQTYDVAPFQNGGVVCVAETSPHTISCPSDTKYAPVGTTIVTPSPGYPSTIEYYNTTSKACTTVPAFTGSNSGSAGTWTLEELNLTKYLGDTIQVEFGYVEGAKSTGTDSCGGSQVGAIPGGGWNIDQFSVYVSGGQTGTPVSENYGSCPTFGTDTTAATDMPTDLWHLNVTSHNPLPSGFTTSPSSIPTGGAWVDAAYYSATKSLTLDPNMWDLLETRPIDLTNAANATLTFNYLWSTVAANMDPPQGLIVEVTPVLANGVTSWTQVWNANIINGADITTNFSATWHNTNISLQGYIGDVVRVGFLVGTNCGGDGDDDANYDYPTQATPTSGDTGCYLANKNCDPGDGPTAAAISGVYVTGVTSLQAGAVVHDSGRSTNVGPPGSLGGTYQHPLTPQQVVLSEITNSQHPAFGYTPLITVTTSVAVEVTSVGGSSVSVAAVWVSRKERP